MEKIWTVKINVKGTNVSVFLSIFQVILNMSLILSTPIVRNLVSEFESDLTFLDDTNGGCKPENPCKYVNCGENQQCREGKCVCKPGYFPNKYGKCQEKINECLTGEHNCHKYATCKDKLNGFVCECNENYKVRLNNKNEYCALS